MVDICALHNYICFHNLKDDADLPHIVDAQVTPPIQSFVRKIGYDYTFLENDYHKV